MQLGLHCWTAVLILATLGPVGVRPGFANEQDLIQGIGLQGLWKLGHTTFVRLAIPEKFVGQVKSVRITTVDGDGVEVAYRRDLTIVTSSSIEIPVRIGRRESVLSAELLDQDSQVLQAQDRTLSAEEGLSAGQPMVWCLGSSMGLEDLVRTATGRTEQRSLSLVSLQNAAEMPSTWLAYQPCNLVVISTADSKLLGEITPDQWQALNQWIRRGGACIIALGGSAESLQQNAGLCGLLPGEIAAGSQIDEPAALESMMVSDQRQRLQPFAAIRLTVTTGEVQLSMKDSLYKQIPWWVDSQFGFGSVRVVASDLDHPSFKNWRQRKALWERLVVGYFDKTQLQGEQDGQTSTTSFLGYTDLIGQLRATLDQFSTVSAVSFSQIAAMLLGILLLIGPVDYYVSVKLLQRPYLSWPLAATVLIVCSAGLTWFYFQLRPDKLVTNSVQIVDVDCNTGRVDGHVWSHIYSSHARNLDMEGINQFNRERAYLDWQGLPGKGLGGLESQLPMERGMNSYTVRIDANLGTALESVGVVAAGTKSIYGTYSLTMNMSNQSKLSELSTVDQLEGEVVNPLDQELRDVVLYYHRWYYLLNSRMPAGDRIRISSQILPKDVVRKFNRQYDVDGKTTATRWNPAERNEVDRLVELLMFHNAATGRNYTSLSHNYQSIIDHSHLTEMDCAILVGRLTTAPVELKLSTSTEQTQPELETGLSRAWCRIVIPVQQAKRGSPK